MSHSPDAPVLSPVLLRLMRGSFTLFAIIIVAAAAAKGFDPARQVPVWQLAVKPTGEICLAAFAWLFPDTAAALTRRRLQALYAISSTGVAIALLSLYLAF